LPKWKPFALKLKERVISNRTNPNPANGNELRIKILRQNNIPYQFSLFYSLGMLYTVTLVAKLAFGNTTGGKNQQWSVTPIQPKEYNYPLSVRTGQSIKYYSNDDAYQLTRLIKKLYERSLQ